jgi:hypothetical protein
MARVQARVIMAAGLVGVGAGLLLISGVGITDEWTGLLGGFIVAGASIGLLNPVIASLAMVFSSISVVSNALRLRRFKAHTTAQGQTSPARMNS